MVNLFAGEKLNPVLFLNLKLNSPRTPLLQRKNIFSQRVVVQKQKRMNHGLLLTPEPTFLQKGNRRQRKRNFNIKECCVLGKKLPILGFTRIYSGRRSCGVDEKTSATRATVLGFTRIYSGRSSCGVDEETSDARPTVLGFTRIYSVDVRVV